MTIKAIIKTAEPVAIKISSRTGDAYRSQNVLLEVVELDGTKHHMVQNLFGAQLDCFADQTAHVGDTFTAQMTVEVRQSRNGISFNEVRLSNLSTESFS